MNPRKFVQMIGALWILAAATLAPAAEVTVRLDGQDHGRTFEGVGAASAGASTRLLFDYPEPMRGQVLDFLFKPHFGAAFQHLKVEIGGGENSTCGSEPTHALTREELANPKARGYEFFLMKGARDRNPKIFLDCLPWCYPGWIKGRFSQDATDWFLAFLEVARKQYGLEVDWISAAQNENGSDRDWIVKSLRPTLDARGYKNVRLQAPDDDSDYWKVFDTFEKDPEFDKAVAAVGYHYINGREPWKIDQESHREPTPKARASGKPLWASEDWSMSGKTWDGTGSMFVARLINKFYIRDRITKTELWCPVDSIYEGLPWSDTGILQADTPWSGHFTVWGSVWAVAHTTQFAQPGWQYLDGGCGQLDPSTWKGSYVTLKDPATGDWSMIVCTDGPMTLKVALAGGSGLKAAKVHVWKSDEKEQFIHERTLTPEGTVFTLNLAGTAIYTLTTTVGQQKGSCEIPPAKPFPFPYQDDFERYAAGATPKYFTDQKGTFEVREEPGRGKVLKQVAAQQGIMWEYMKKIVKPYSVIGDQAWTDYALSADVKIAGGDVELGGRYGDQNKLSYRWIVARGGAWKLAYQARTLAEGKVDGFDPAAWHALRLVLKGQKIIGYLDGKELARATDATRKNGMAILASTYDANMFDNIKITR